MTDPITDEDGFTELVDPNVPRVDLVGAPANGTPGWLLMKQDAQAGLMPADAIRDLIGKSTTEPIREETVTMSGSPGAIAKLIHEASLRREATEQVAKEATYEEVVKAKYNADDLKRMAANGEAMKDGSYPIADKEDLTRAIRAVGRGGGSHDAIRQHIMTRAKSLGASSEIPDNWNKDGSLSEGSVAKMVGGEPDDGDGMDPTVVLAEPDDDAPGDPTDPGSPAWEAIDAATAQKWLSIAYRVKNALGVMAERELLEAASADPDDAEDAWDLQDAQCAMDYVISVLANFAADEQAEATLGAEEMDAVGKALAGADRPVGTIEAFAVVRKAGRSLSAANEQAIRDAVSSLQRVLASLPAVPVEKTANEESNMPQPTTAEDATTESGQEPAMGAQQADSKAEAGVPVTDMAKADAAPEKSEMTPVYDAKGNLIGAVDPKDLTVFTSVSGQGASSDTDDSADDASDDDAQTTDLAPQPAADAGTPADATPDDEAVAKTTNDTNTDLSEMFKSSLLDAVKDVMTKQSAMQDERLATIGDAVLEVAGLVETLKGQVQQLEEQPEQPKVFTQGAGPRPLPQHLRGQNAGAPVDMAKAHEMRRNFYSSGDPREQNRIANEMQSSAIDALAAIHGGGARQ